MFKSLLAILSKLTPASFEAVATGVARLITAIGLIIGGLFALTKFIAFEQEALDIEREKARAEIRVQLSSEETVGLIPAQQSTQEFVLRELIATQENCEVEVDDEKKCIEQARQIAELNVKVDEHPKAICSSAFDQQHLPFKNVPLVVSHQINFSNGSALPLLVSVKSMKITDYGEFRITEPELQQPSGFSVKATYELTEVLDEIFEGPISAPIGTGYSNQFSAIYTLPLTLACGETSKLFTIATELDFQSEIADEATISFVASGLRNLLRSCYISRAVTEAGEIKAGCNRFSDIVLPTVYAQ